MTSQLFLQWIGLDFSSCPTQMNEQPEEARIERFHLAIEEQCKHEDEISEEEERVDNCVEILVELVENCSHFILFFFVWTHCWNVEYSCQDLAHHTRASVWEVFASRASVGMHVIALSQPTYVLRIAILMALDLT